MKVASKRVTEEEIAQQLAQFAVEALLEEVRLSPKPGLVDKLNNGTHHDLTLSMMEKSAEALQECFYDMSLASYNRQPSQYLRERLAAIGRYGEQQMLDVTGQVNTHKGAIWALGLLTGAATVVYSAQKENYLAADHDLLNRVEAEVFSAGQILKTAGVIASFRDRFVQPQKTHGSEVLKVYPVRSAREEAILGFPSLLETAIPAWKAYSQDKEEIRRLNVLLSLMAVVDDTCILHRSDMIVLRKVQEQCKNILKNGGLGNAANWRAYTLLDQYITGKWVSPGGSADLLAATIFIKKITQHFKINS